MTKPTPLIFAALFTLAARGAELKMTGLADGFRAEAGQAARSVWSLPAANLATR